MKWESAVELLPPHWEKVMLRFDNDEENLGMLNPYGKGWISFKKGTGTKVTHWSHQDSGENNA